MSRYYDATAIRRRPLWKGNFQDRHEFVAVRPCRRGSLNLQVGDRVPKENLSRVLLRALYVRQIIGVDGDPWSDMMLARFERKVDRAVEAQEKRERKKRGLLERLNPFAQDRQDDPTPEDGAVGSPLPGGASSSEGGVASGT